MSNVSDPARKSSLKQSVIEASNALLQAEAQREHAKEVMAHIAEEYEIEKSTVASLVKLYHKQNASTVKAKAETEIELYESLFGEV